MSAKENIGKESTRNTELLKSLRRRQQLYNLPMSLAMKHQKQTSGTIDYKRYMAVTRKFSREYNDNLSLLYSSTYTNSNFAASNDFCKEIKQKELAL